VSIRPTSPPSCWRPASGYCSASIPDLMYLSLSDYIQDKYIALSQQLRNFDVFDFVLNGLG